MEKTKVKHLEFIQNVVSRMAQNSFVLKGWALTIVVAAFSFLEKDKFDDPRLWYLIAIPVLIFWMLDGYFLWQERLFRKLYDDVRKKSEEELGKNPFAMNPMAFDSNKFNDTTNYLGTTFHLKKSGTIFWFYMSLMGLIGLIGYFVFS